MKFSIKNLVFIAVCAALIAVCSWITVPFAVVPFTLQTFAVFFALSFLGGKKGSISILIYIILGAVGVPVFSGFSGGFGHLLGPTGGYIFGFIASGIVFILLELTKTKKSIVRLLSLIISLIPCYLVGTLWFYFTYGSAKGMSLWAVLMACVIPFIIPDVAKIVLAWFISGRIKKITK